jgi:hypothetical protein
MPTKVATAAVAAAVATTIMIITAKNFRLILVY